MKQITPHLWFDSQAVEATTFYTSLFPHSKITHTSTIKNTPSGDCDIVSFELSGQPFMAISAGPYFNINSSISFFLNFDPSKDSQAKEHLESTWEKLSDGGNVMMPLQEYPFSKLYGWVQDKYGVSWQLILTNPEGDERPFIVPCLLFSRDVTNKAEEAEMFYQSVFKQAPSAGEVKQGILARYPEDTGPAKKGSLMYSDFMIENTWFAAMDSGVQMPDTFNEAVSLMISCDSQEEIDYYWEKLSAVPESEQCGWLKDKYGVSWQVTSTKMEEMMSNGTPEQVDRVTKCFLQMKKFDLAKLQDAFEGK